MKGVKVLVLTMFAVLIAGAAWSAELAGYWSFDENQGTVAKTSAVKGYDGEIHGAKWAPGKVGSALRFNGESDYVEVKDEAAGSPFALTSMSISAWIKPEAYPQPSPVWVSGIAGKGYYTESTYGLRLMYSGSMNFTVYGPFGEGGKTKDFRYDAGKKNQVSLGEWHHVVVTYDNENVKIYLDGRLDYIHKEDRLPGINKQSIFIGSTSPNYRYFKGIIDEVKIYKGALTDAEVEAEYKKSGGTARLTSGNLPKINEAPSLDGALSDPCWQKALKVEFVNNATGKAPKAATTGYICYDAKNLYIAFDCKEPSMDKIKANITERGGNIWEDDCVEAFLDPGVTHSNYYHFLLNSKNVQADEKWFGTSQEPGWNGNWQSSTALHADGWTAEMKIPLSNFALASNTGSSWGLNLCRGRKTDVENTAWAPTVLGFHVPEMFGIMREFNADFNPYKTDVSTPAFSCVFENGKPLLRLRQSFTNSSASSRRVNIKIQNLSGKESISRDTVLLPGKAQEIILPVSLKKDLDLYRFRIEITDAADGSTVYKVGSAAKSPALIQSYLDRSYYTDESVANIFGTINITGKTPPNLSIRTMIQSKGKIVADKTMPVSGTEFNVPVPIKSLPAGEYNATVSMMVNKDTICSETLRLGKYPSTECAIKVDARNLSVLVDGKPYFPMGILSIPDILIPEYAEAGYNIARDNSPDIAYYNGFMTLASTYYSATREDYRTMAPDALEKKIKGGRLPDTIKRYINHPAFAGYFWDEPRLDEIKGTQVLSRVTRELDPYHPIMPVLMTKDTGVPPGMYDIFSSDIYWYNAPYTKKYMSCARLESAAATAEAIRKPFWFMPNAAGWIISSSITPREQRIQTYLALIHGAKGIIYWSYLQMYPAMTAEMKKLGREVSELSPALLIQSPRQTVTGVEATDVYALAKLCNGDCYLLTANNSADAEKTMRIKVSSAGAAKSAKVLFENRTVPVKDGAIEDKYAPYATHVYVLERADTKQPIQISMEKLASASVPVPEVRRWPDVDVLDEKVGNSGFEDQEEGQPRIWIASCGWETPEYCSLSTKEFHEGARSLKLCIPRTTLYTSGTGFGWNAGANVTAFDLGKLRPACRYGHIVKNGIFKVDLPDGKYSIKVLSSTSELFEMKGNTGQALSIKTVEIPVHKGIENTIKENTFDTAVEGGQFSLFIPSGSIYSLTITPQSGGNVRAFDFGPGDLSVAAGHKLVSASKLASVNVISQNNDCQPKIKLKADGKYKLSVYMKSDTPNLPVIFGLKAGEIWGERDYKTVSIGREWKKYEMTVTKKGPNAWIYVELRTPGTIWVDDFALEKN